MGTTGGWREDGATVENPAKGWTLVAMILASGIVFLDSSVVNVALPAIDGDLQAGLSGLQWIVEGYILALSALLILGGALGDLYGRKRVMVAGLVGFGVASVACGLAPSVGWLVGGRILQGMAGALLVPGSLAILRAVHADEAERGRAIGRWSGWSGITTLVGPLVGGWLVDALSWRWVFLINVPLIVATLWLLRRVPESRDERAARGLDWAGVALAALGLGGVAYGLIEGPVAGWRSPLVVASLAAGVLALVAFPFVQARVRNPLVPLGLFRSRNFSGANGTTLGVYFALYGTTFFLVLFLQNVMGLSAFQAGLALSPISVVLLVLSPTVGRLAGQRGARGFMTVGPLICAASLLLLTRLAPGANLWTTLLPAVLVLALGLAATVAPLTNTVVSAVAAERAGVAAAVNNVVSRVAALLAIALLGVVVTWSFNGALERERDALTLTASERATLDEVAQNPTGTEASATLPAEAQRAVARAYTRAFRWAMVVSAAMCAVGSLIAFATIRGGEQRIAG